MSINFLIASVGKTQETQTPSSGYKPSSTYLSTAISLRATFLLSVLKHGFWLGFAASYSTSFYFVIYATIQAAISIISVVFFFFLLLLS